MEKLGRRACDRLGAAAQGPASALVRRGNALAPASYAPQIDKVQGLCAASQGTGLMADRWGAGGPSRECWEQRAPIPSWPLPLPQVCPWPLR